MYNQRHNCNGATLRRGIQYKAKIVNNIRRRLHLLRVGWADSRNKGRKRIFHCPDSQEQRVDGIRRQKKEPIFCDCRMECLQFEAL